MSQKKIEVSSSWLKHKAWPIAMIILVVSLSTNVYLFYLIKSPKKVTKDTSKDLSINAGQSISQIEGYLDSISPSYVADVQALAKADDIPSWGCGPSSYSLVKIIDQRFFQNKLPIAALYNSDTAQQYEIVERFGLHGDDSGNTIDHAWIEIYYQDQFLFIDPTIGQFGGTPKITYQTFTVGDPTISSTLKTNYGIVDIRLNRLVQKEVNRVPVDQEPYPGTSISQSVLNYYIGVEADRNDVNNGTEPSDWINWDKYLISKYTS